MVFFYTPLSWVHPLEIFPVFQKESSMLFYSGTAAGKFSFFPLHIKRWWTAQHEERDFLKTLSKRYTTLTNTRKKISENIPFPFTGGLCGVFAYDFVRQWENIPHNKKFHSSIPTAIFAEYEAGIVCKESTKECWYFCWAKNKQEFEKHAQKIQKTCTQNSEHKIQNSSSQAISCWKPEISKNKYISHVRSCQNALQEGKSFQINFSQTFTAETNVSDWEIFLQLTKKNPAPMMFYYSPPSKTKKSVSILSSSPERLFSLTANGKLFTQPIAGTRKRGKTPEEDLFLEQELQNSPKEKAEHSMLVDLLRNDFGKVCAFGSITVQDFARVEKYASVMHLVTDITGKIDHSKTVFDCLPALFPGGTITGAPKIETMKILATEETSARSFYCGSAGYISYSGEADFNICIRTLEKQNNTLMLRAGGGIVVEADPTKEYEETLHKAKGVQHALQ